MPTYRLWTPNDTYRGTVDAETPAKALLKRHREDHEDRDDLVADWDGTGPGVAELDYDPDLDAIVWPNDRIRESLGDVDDWRIEPADD
jgi:hypothetical protein